MCAQTTGRYSACIYLHGSPMFDLVQRAGQRRFAYENIFPLWTVQFRFDSLRRRNQSTALRSSFSSILVRTIIIIASESDSRLIRRLWEANNMPETRTNQQYQYQSGWSDAHTKKHIVLPLRNAFQFIPIQSNSTRIEI